MTMLHTLIPLPEPCTKIYTHIPHPITLVGVNTSIVAEYLCPGYTGKE